MGDKLGELRLLDVREFWANEAADFTPWLARDENIAKLGAAIGLELEVENTEVAAGPFSADILARDTASSDYVIIENQLGKTDHDHLGKCITYAAVLGARTVVWVAPRFTEEHKKSLDWLNDHSSDDLAFYGVQPELWQIDESKPAVRFNVLSRPTGTMRKVIIGPHPSELSDVRKLQVEWWTAFRDKLVESRAFPSVQTPAPRAVFNVAVGRSGFVISNSTNSFDNRIGVRLYMRSRYGGEAALEQLLESKDEIEQEIGHKLRWNPNPEGTDKIIAALMDADLARRDKWAEYLQWMVDMNIRFRKTFGPRIKELDLDTSPTEEDEEG